MKIIKYLKKLCAVITEVLKKHFFGDSFAIKIISNIYKNYKRLQQKMQ
jgi:hypothetical protein